MEEAEKRSVLIVDDEIANIMAITRMLSPRYTVYAATSGRDAIEATQERLPDVVLLDILMPDMDGYEVLAWFKNNERTKEIPVVFVTGLESDEDEERGLALGAADYICKPLTPAIVKLRVRNQIQILDYIGEIRQMSVTDQLTGLSNRRDLDNRLQILWEHAKRNGAPIGLLLMDIDDFKKYNDTYGHLQGDTALKAVAEAVKRTVKRSVDVLARWGGEEFLALLPDTDIHGASAIAEAIRKNVEETPIVDDLGDAASVTVSIGVNACAPSLTNQNRDSFIRGADEALYNAKRQGKNTVRVCEAAAV
ncbi:MAG: diguanylate cyclase [Oscillospiraceae bacterium]|jgi:diguanylate cyclase (GGDEF)-like protein|nr:diguanylate cyclase [Oscillospiraceae bacterium]